MRNTLIGGDLCPCFSRKPPFARCRADAPFNNLLPEFERRSHEIPEKGFVERSWANYYQGLKRTHETLMRLHYNSQPPRQLERKLGFPDRWLCGEETRWRIREVIRYETHSEVLLTLLVEVTGPGGARP